MKRFAFYGRVSTEDQQDPASSRNWQLARSRQIIAGHGEIVVEYFDIGRSRSLPWRRRPEASRLLDALADRARGFDAVVIGEPQRAFYDNQFGLTFPIFDHYGVELWVPEVGGPVDPDSEAHDILMSLYGGMSKGERMRIKTRVRTAMATQASLEGRFLGGRPPYGYVLVDAGRHPNPAKAANGQRLHQLAIDSIAAPIVHRIFTEYSDGLGLHLIATGLNRDGIPSPSAHDPRRNRHRTAGQGKWAKSAVRAILTNPRYTGHEVWNKQRKDEVLLDVDDVGRGHVTKMRWNDAADWIISPEPTHEPIVSRELFDTVQAMFDRNKRAATRNPRPGRQYVLAGRMRCGVCGRRMQGQWNHGRAYYRCRFTDEYPDTDQTHPRNVYVKEDELIPGIDRWLASLFDDEHIDQTCAHLAGASEPDPDELERDDALRAAIADCDRRLDNYRALLDRGADIAIAATWIAETERERANLQHQLARRTSHDQLSPEQVRALVTALSDIVDVLAAAEPAEKAELYDQLGITVAYKPNGTVTIESRPRGVQVRVGGGT